MFGGTVTGLCLPCAVRLPHTEKEPGMFGTLVVQLPVSGGHAGGSLEVTGPTGQKHVWRTAKVRDKGWRWDLYGRAQLDLQAWNAAWNMLGRCIADSPILGQHSQ
jgi:hypothetical protein